MDICCFQFRNCPGRAFPAVKCYVRKFSEALHGHLLFPVPQLSCRALTLLSNQFCRHSLAAESFCLSEFFTVIIMVVIYFV